MTHVPQSLGTDVLEILLPLALQRAGLPPAVVAAVMQLGAPVAREAWALLEAYGKGEPLETFRAELPDLDAVIRAFEEQDR